MADYDVRDYASGGLFVKKQDLRANGPRTVVVKDVEEADGFPGKNGQPKKELVLVFEDGTKLALRARAQRDAMAELHGFRTSKWIGKSIELFCDPSVFNPKGGEPGGVRLRVPGAMRVPAAYRSDLEEPVITKGNGAEQPPDRDDEIGW
jgi:hypothetical protein